jgi:putative glutathione S-transferase
MTASVVQCNQPDTREWSDNPIDGVIAQDPRAEFPAVSGRYVVYVGNACPWCHRVSLTVALRGLQDRVQVVKMTDDAERASRGGWVFEPGAAATRDPVFGAADLREVYDAAVPAVASPYRGRCTAPFMVDGTRRRAVNNEVGLVNPQLNPQLNTVESSLHIS